MGKNLVNKMSSVAASRSEVAGAAANPVFAVKFLTTGIVIFTDDIISSADLKGGTFDEIGCDFFSRIRINALDCRARYVHLLGALFLCKTDIVDQSDGFIFFESHNLDIIFFLVVSAIEKVIFRKAADAFALFRSCHVLSSFPVYFMLS